LLDETRMNLRSVEARRDEVRAQVRSAQAALDESRAKLDQARADVAVVDIPESEAGWVQVGQPATFKLVFDSIQSDLPVV